MKPILFIAGGILMAGAADGIDSGLSLLAKGQFDEGRAAITSAYTRDPSSVRAQLVYGRLVPDGVKAKYLYLNITQDSAAHDSLRAQAWIQLGFFYTAVSLHDSAVRAFSHAEQLNQTPRVVHQKAFAAMNAGDYKTAETIWATQAADDSGAYKGQALYYLGNAFYMQGSYEKAYRSYSAAMGKTLSAWYVPAMAGACISAYHSNDTTRSAALYTELMGSHPNLCETAWLEKVVAKQDDFSDVLGDSPGKKKGPVAEPKPAEARDTKTTYTLQVGAFSTSENAQRMYTEMKQTFSAVTVKKEPVNGTMFHKVRIGSFADEGQALGYGEVNLRSRSIQFRVVKE